MTEQKPEEVSTILNAVRALFVCALIATCVALHAVSFNSNVTAQSARESGVLQPGGEFVHSDGVRVADPTRSVPHEVGVWIERINPASTVPIPKVYRLIGKVYKIGTSERVIPRPGSFRIAIQLPNDLPVEKGRIIQICLYSDGSIYTYPDREPTYQLHWYEAITGLDFVQRLATIRFGILDQEGTAFALVFKPD
jgi:hypothetical protein